MVEVPLLKELALVSALGAGVTVALRRIRLPVVAGMLAAGALMGPSGLGLVSSIEDLEVLSEVGVVVLLFTIGLEFSLTRLKAIFRQVALGGAMQVGVTLGATYLVARALGQGVGASVFYGCAVALSSTAIVLKTLGEREELGAPHGRFMVGTLLFQDLMIVPMVLVVPFLAGGTQGLVEELSWAMGKAALAVVGVVGLSRFLVPRALEWVDASRSREVFMLAIVAMCIGTAWLTSLAGLSLALGAFLGGMVVADTEHSHRAMGDMLPIRDVFVSVFFVTMGMLFDAGVVWAMPLEVLGLALGLIGGKALIAGVSAMAMGFPARVAWLAGLGLAQFGEFGFVLTKVAQANGVVTDAQVAPLLTAGILSMFVTPLLAWAAPHVTAGEKLLRPLERIFGVKGVDEIAPEHAELTGHVIVVGFGPGGESAARALEATGLDYVVLEMNMENVRRGQRDGRPVYYADATSPEALAHAGLERARQVVLLLSDALSTKRIVHTVHALAPEVHVLVRARYTADLGEFAQMGADDVVAEELEGSAEVVARMLRHAGVPEQAAGDQLELLHARLGGA
jgi:CPA2 family monovalent cation:H+ antiporter-2